MVAPNARCLDGTVAEDIRLAHASYWIALRGVAGHSTYRQDVTFSSTHFSIVLMLVIVLVLERGSHAAFRLHRFLSRGSPQSLEGSRFITYRFQRRYLSQTATRDWKT